MPVIKKEKKDLNQVSPTRIQQINEAAKTEEETQLQMSPATEVKPEIPVSSPAEPVKETVPTEKEKPVKQKEEQINIKLPLEVKTKWKKFFVDSNINITQGIIFAVENLIQEVSEGEATLTRGGVFKKK